MNESKQPSATFSLRFKRGNVYDIQLSGDVAPESIDMAIDTLRLLKRTYYPNGIKNGVEAMCAHCNGI